MDKQVAHLNIEHYRRLLANEPEGSKREILLRLLAEDETKLAALSGAPKRSTERSRSTKRGIAIPANG